MSTANRMEKVKVLYIVGWGRSGSTILDRILGQIDGFTSLGELRYIWDRNFLDDRLCGCGKPFSQCEEWMSVIERAYGAEGGIDPREMVRYRDKFMRTRHLMTLFFPGAKEKIKTKVRPYLDKLDKLYPAIREHFGCRVIVDSSKFPSYAFTLDLLENLDLYFVHLVRDPRAVAFSWMRRKLQPDTGKLQPMKEHDPLSSTLLWTSWNFAAGALWGRRKGKYMFLRYEDFIANPRKAVQRIIGMLGEKVDRLPFVDDHTVNLGINHTVSGNPDRFQAGPIRLRMDDEWRSKIRPVDRWVATALALPLLRRYGYSIV